MKLKKKFKILIIIIVICLGFCWLLKPKDSKIKDITDLEKKEIKEAKKSIKLTLVGDLLFESPFYNAVNKGYDKNVYFSLVKDYFKEDNLSIGNMEVVIGNENLKVSGDGYNFCAPEYIGDLVSSLDFEVLGTANNHAYDRGTDGVYSTLDYFRNKSDIVPIGTHKKEDSNSFNILDIEGIKIGITSWTYGTNQKPQGDNIELINYYKDINSKEIYKDKIKEEIKELKEKSDIVLVIIHWGNEFTFKPTQEQKDIALFLSELGVDIILGSHSHSIQPVEFINNKTIVFYSMGNFTSQDDDIARTPKGQETFDNAYQFGLLSTLTIDKNKDSISINNIKTNIIVNYFDKDLNNFKLIPLDKYTKEYEETHYRYGYGLTKDFISKTYEDVVDEQYR